MGKWAVALIVFFLVSCATPSHFIDLVPVDNKPVQLTDRQKLAKMRERVVQIRVACIVENEAGQLGVRAWKGTGVYFASHPMGGEVIATAAHVADMSDACLAFVGSQKVDFISKDTVHDVALLHNPKSSGHGSICSSDYYLGMPVIAMGFPKQIRTEKTAFQVTRGWLITEDDTYMRVSSSFFFGSSGGPVFDEDGNLLGLSVSMLGVWGFPIDDQYLVAPARHVFKLYKEI